jgi:hypothetical protein
VSVILVSSKRAPQIAAWRSRSRSWRSTSRSRPSLVRP